MMSLKKQKGSNICQKRTWCSLTYKYLQGGLYKIGDISAICIQGTLPMCEVNLCFVYGKMTLMPEDIATSLFSNQTIWARGHKFDNLTHLHIHTPAYLSNIFSFFSLHWIVMPCSDFGSCGYEDMLQENSLAGISLTVGRGASNTAAPAIG